MDRKKKLETSLEGLFSKTKGSNETDDQHVKTSEPIAPEKNNKPAVKKEEPKQASKKPAGKTVQVKKEKKTEQKTSPLPKQEPITENKAVDATSTDEVVKEIPKTEPVQPAPISSPEVKPQEDEPKKPVEKVDLTLAAITGSELAVQTLEGGKEIQLLIFEINNVAYGIDVGMVQTIIKPQSVFLVPGTAEYLKGLINLRGEVVAVIDLRTRFDLPTQDIDKDTRFVVVKVNDIMASMVVDCVHGVETIPLSVIERPSGLVMDIDNRYLTGMARYSDRIILILDLLQTIQPRAMEQR
jgi:purine-binding chemotaxis protein CheW